MNSLCFNIVLYSNYSLDLSSVQIIEEKFLIKDLFNFYQNKIS